MNLTLVECSLALFWAGFIGLHVWIMRTPAEEVAS